MKGFAFLLSLLLVLTALFLAACQPVAAPPAQPAAPTALPPAPTATQAAPTAVPAAPTPSVEAQIANAMSAALTVVGKDATVLDWPAAEGGSMVELRKGTNGWTCLTDWPVSPGNDPLCLDPVFTKWNDALGTAAPFTVERPAVAYMLVGGSDPSNTDPFATEPAAGEEWISTPSHVMLLAPGGFNGADFSTVPKQDEPYIMWDGTPYEHLMVPVVAMSKDAMGDASAEMKNIMGAAPAAIIGKATIKGNPTAEGGDMVTLQKGDSTWVCYADRLVSPGNDPSCNDAMWEELFAMATPKVTHPGVSYMLEGGSDESNTDPMAKGPPPGEDWITTPPHLMILMPGGFDAKDFTTDHTSGYPYIMWDDTEYEHLMIPVADMPETVEATSQAPLQATANMSATVMLPNGFQPEGIAVGKDGMAYVGSVGSGTIYRLDLRTGEGSLFVGPQKTPKVLGMVYDRRTDLLYVAGHESGNGLVYDGLTGELIANVQFATGSNGLVNDVALSKDAVYFTDSKLPLVYQLPLAAVSHLPDPLASKAISLTGEFEYLPEGTNGNGIVASDDGAKLIIATTDLGKLYAVDVATGEATELALDAETELYHDGLVLVGDTLYVVNYNNKIYVIKLDPEWTSGKLVRTITDPKLEAPATAALSDEMLYVVNARWDAEQTPETEFWLTKVAP